jgi:hypothetical protein
VLKTGVIVLLERWLVDLDALSIDNSPYLGVLAIAINTFSGD